MFEARLCQSAIFRKILEAIKEILREAVFQCTDSGIQLQAIDDSHVTLVSLNLRSDGFDKYRCDKNISLGINLSSVLKVMKCAGNGDTMIIKVLKDDDNLHFMFESQSKEKVSEFQLKLMNLDYEHLNIPDMDYACVIKMPSNEFGRICKELSQFGETLSISCSKEGAKFSVSGDHGSAYIKLVQTSNTGNDDSVTIHNLQPISASFAMRHIASFAKAVPLSPMICICMSEDAPLLVELKLGDMGHLKYYLASKIDD